MLNKINRLKKNKEFNYVYKKGKFVNSTNFSLHYVDTKLNVAKFGISVNKTVGNSVVRSKTKRIITEIIRLNIDKFAIKNYVFTLKPSIKNVDYHTLNEEVLELINNNACLRKSDDNV